ncbi:MAG: glycosyltransferase family 4 protein [Coriobacteriia bacterium]|nr:glycosyltransferase family 4 protein [Coriobacteriia bacterium]
MRIGFFTDTYTPQINGVVTSIRLFAKALERQGHSVYIFAPTPRQATDGPHIVRIPSVPFAFQPEMRLASIYSAHADRLVRRANLDVIHSHDPFAIGLYGLAVAKRYRIPYVHTYHTLYPEYVHYIWETRFTRAMAERLSREFCDQCDMVLAPSTKINKALHDWGVTAPVVTLPTGVDAQLFAERDPEELDEFRRRFGISQADKLLTFVGRLGKEKNVDLLIDAMAKVTTPNARLVIVGNGPYRPELEARIARLGIRDRVIFTDYLNRTDVRSAYLNSEALFFASTSETQGLVIAEAMASGLPVVAVNDLAIADAVSDGVNGFLVPESAGDLAAAADRLMSDPKLRAEMSRVSLERAEDLCIDNQAARLAEVYTRVLEVKGPRRRSLRPPAAVARVEKQLTTLRRRGRNIVRRYL